MAKEYIEREAAKIKLVALYKAYDTDENHERKLALLEIDLALKSIPAADVVPVRHGRWEKATGMMPPEYCGLHICSECGHYAGRKPPYGGKEMLSDYCPNCGARMDGDRE